MFCAEFVLGKLMCYFGFEVFTPVTTKSTIVWNVTLCSLLEIYRIFKRIYCLDFGRKE
jgi:hypothetical protein